MIRLVPHPDFASGPVSSIDVMISRKGLGYIGASFRLVGAIDDIAWPGAAASGHGPWTRQDGLWAHSCFEIFAGTDHDSGYIELNFATSGAWAAYAFFDYRIGMRTADDVRIEAANWRIAAHRADLNLLVQAPTAYDHADWRLGLSAVIEGKDGRKSYWALAHGDGPPDFHNRDCFTLRLPAPAGP